MADNYVQDASYFGGGYFGGTEYSYFGEFGTTVPVIYGRPVKQRITTEVKERVTGEVKSYYGDRDCK